MYKSKKDPFKRVSENTWLYEVEPGTSLVIIEEDNSYWWYLHKENRLKAQGVSRSYDDAVNISIYESRGLK